MTNQSPECDHRSTEKGWWQEGISLLREVQGYAQANTDAARTQDDQDTWRAHWRNVTRAVELLSAVAAAQPPAHQENSPRSAGDASMKKGDMTDQAPELLPCPFCKAQPVCPEDAGDGDYVVMCISCGASSQYSDERSTVIKAWNTRPPSERPAPRVREALAELERACEALATGRSQETYNAMLHDGRSDQLAALDVARRNARNALALTPVVAREPVGLARVQAAADDVVSRVAEYDDRTSPDDFPEALLITPSELHQELVRFAEDIDALTSPPPASAVREALEQISTVCTDNIDAAKSDYRMALHFVRQIAIRALSIKGTADEKAIRPTKE